MKKLEELQELFTRWDNGYYDLEPRAFRRFSKGLLNLVSFAVETLKAYEIYKYYTGAGINEENKRLKQEGKKYFIDTVLPGIIDEYFSHRLFELCYLGAWASLETYLRDVAWLVLAQDPSTGKITNLKRKNKNGAAYHSRQTLVAELIHSLRNFGDILGLYRRVLNVNLNKLEPSKSLIAGRKKRNKLAHSGHVLGYYPYSQRYDEWKKRMEYGVTNDEDLVSEEFLCETLVQMWQLGDLLRKQFFKERCRDDVG